VGTPDGRVELFHYVAYSLKCIFRAKKITPFPIAVGTANFEKSIGNCGDGINVLLPVFREITALCERFFDIFREVYIKIHILFLEF